MKSIDGGWPWTNSPLFMARFTQMPRERAEGDIRLSAPTQCMFDWYAEVALVVKSGPFHTKLYGEARSLRGYPKRRTLDHRRVHVGNVSLTPMDNVARPSRAIETGRCPCTARCLASISAEIILRDMQGCNVLFSPGCLHDEPRNCLRPRGVSLRTTVGKGGPIKHTRSQP